MIHWKNIWKTTSHISINQFKETIYNDLPSWKTKDLESIFGIFCQEENPSLVSLFDIILSIIVLDDTLFSQKLSIFKTFLQSGIRDTSIVEKERFFKSLVYNLFEKFLIFIPVNEIESLIDIKREKNSETHFYI